MATSATVSLMHCKCSRFTLSTGSQIIKDMYTQSKSIASHTVHIEPSECEKLHSGVPAEAACG